MTKFGFKKGTTYRGVDAQVAGEELERIRETRGELAPSAIVEESRPKDAPLHGAFTWDNKKAADEYRLIEARQLVRIVTVLKDDEEEQQPYYVHVAREPAVNDTEREGRYEPIHIVVQSPDLFERALSELESRVSSALKAVADLKHAAEGSNDSERLAKVALAVRALETASEAIRSLH